MIYCVASGLKPDNYEVYQDKEIIVYYKGIFFMRGYHAGRESIQQMLNLYNEEKKLDFEKYYGSFSMIICFSIDNMFFFTDNSRMNCFYYSERTISDNFLELAAELLETEKHFDEKAISMLFQLGGVYYGKTMLEGVNALNSFEYLCVSNKKISKIKKPISDIDGKSTISDVTVFFKEVAYALEESKVACAITGGYDSRMVMALLSLHIPLDLFISGDNADHNDIIIAEKVAKTAQLPFEVVKMNNNVNEEWVKSSFCYFQGVCPSSHYIFHNVMDFNKERKSKGYQVALNGDGGVLHKDWEWIQDFPFYNRKKTNFRKLYYQRIKILNYEAWLGRSIQTQHFDEDMIEQLKMIGKESNTKTYDSYYYNVYLAKNCPYANANDISYGPLMEYDLVKYSYHLPRRERYFYNYMRKITTNANPAVAKLRTVYGTTASSYKKDLLLDFFRQMKQYIVKAKRYLLRKYANRNNVADNLSKLDVNQQVRKLQIAHFAVDYCVECGYLKENLDYDTIPFALIDRAIQVYLLAACIGKGDNTK